MIEVKQDQRPATYTLVIEIPAGSPKGRPDIHQIEALHLTAHSNTCIEYRGLQHIARVFNEHQQLRQMLVRLLDGGVTREQLPLVREARQLLEMTHKEIK